MPDEPGDERRTPGHATRRGGRPGRARGGARGRVLALLRARLRAGPRGGLPIATWFGQAVISALFCGLVEDALPPFAYGLFALGLTAALLAIPLLGDLGWLLRADPAEEWVRSLPLHRRELRLARTLHLLLLLSGLALASLLPATLLLPEGTPAAARAAFPLLGLGLAAFLAAFLLGVQSLCAGRAEGVLVLLQTALVVGVVVGLVVGVRHVPALARVATPEAGGAATWLFPPAWFAAPLAAAGGAPARWWLPLVAAAASLLLLALLPAPPAAPRARREPWLAVLLRPVRRAATRLWVRSDERGPFDLVYDALPREREVVLRTYPMIGIPLAFLLIAAAGPADEGAREGLLSLLLFTAPVYLPVLLTQVPASASAGARWLHETAPVPEGAVVAGTLKAVAVRFLVPLYAVLGGLAWVLVGPGFLLRLGPPALLAALLVLSVLYRVCVRDRPLSVPPDEVQADLDWLGLLGGLALALVFVSVLAERSLTPATSLLATALLAAAQGLWLHRLRRTLG